MSTISTITGRPTRPHDTTLPTASDLRVGSSSHRLLGTFTTSLKVEDSNDPNDISHLRFTAGGHFGAKNGYASVGDAVDAMMTLTEDLGISAAVVRQGARYFGYHLGATDLDKGLNSTMYNVDLARMADGGTLTMKANTKDSMLAAVVGGYYAHRFRS